MVGPARTRVAGGGGGTRALYGPTTPVEGDDLDVRRAYVGPDQDRFSVHRMVKPPESAWPGPFSPPSFQPVSKTRHVGMLTTVIILSKAARGRRGDLCVRCSMLYRVGRLRISWGRYRKVLRSVVYLASLGLAVHLILPRIPGLEHSAGLVAEASPFLVGAAFVAELLSELSYAELLGRSVAAASRSGTDLRSRNYRGLGPLFMLRLTVCGYGAAHVLPGGGAAAATVTYGALRARGVDRRTVGLAVAAVTGLVYGALFVLFSGSLLYMFVRGDLTPAETVLTLVAAAALVAAFLAVYAV